MNIEFNELFHPRILKHCESLCIDGHYKNAALEAMTQVELALKEKSGINNKFGVNLCSGLIGEGKGIKLRVPFGEDSVGWFALTPLGKAVMQDVVRNVT